MGRRIHCCNRDSVYWNHRKSCEENFVNRVQDAGRCALFRAPRSNVGGNSRVLTAEEGVNNVDPNVPALYCWSHGASKAEHGVFTGAVHGTRGDGHPRRLRGFRVLDATHNASKSALPIEPITTIALRSDGDALLTSK